MSSYLSSLVTYLAGLAAVQLGRGSSAATPLTTEIYRFPTFTFLENIAVQANGSLLLTTLGGGAIVYGLNPHAAEPAPYVVASFPTRLPSGGTSGIAEVAPDVFAVAAGVHNLSARRGSDFEVHEVDARTTPARTRKLASIPETVLLNGMTTLPGSGRGTGGSDGESPVLLIADSDVGAVYALDSGTGAYEVVVKDPALAPPGPSPDLGINGLRVADGALFFTNSHAGHFGSLPIGADGRQAGDARIIARMPAVHSGPIRGWDDFVLDAAGNAWVTAHPNGLDRVGPDGEVAVVVGAAGPEDATLGRIGPTACAWGRTAADQALGRLYVVTGDGTIVAVDTARVPKAKDEL